MPKGKQIAYKSSYKKKLVFTTIVIALGLIFSNFAVATMNINNFKSSPFLFQRKIIERDDSSFETEDEMWDDPEPLDTTWDVRINFTEPGSYTDYIIFGEATDGSDGQDSYDIPNPPPGIPPFLDSYFTTDFSSPYDKLLQEIKFYPDTDKLWNFTAWWTGSSSTTVTISWDPNDVDASEYDSVILYDSTSTPVADMLVDSSYSASVASYNIISFQIICMVDLDAPEITDNSPGSGTTGDSYTFNATVIDNLFNAENLTVKVDWAHGIFSSNDTMSNSGGDYFEATITLDENSVADLTYHFYAVDNAITPNANYTAELTATVIDNDNPIITGDSGNEAVGTGDTVTLWVTATDNIAVTSAEIDIDGGGAVAMTWDAGDSRWEYDYTAPSGDDSDHTYELEVFDAEGLSDTSGPYDIVVTDNDDPAITNVDANPDVQLVDNYVNITATVTDNINVNTVKVSIDGPLGFTPINVSMTQNGGDIYYYDENYSIPGTYNYTIWASDDEGNAITSATYQFEMVQELQITNLTVKWNFVAIPFNKEVHKDDLFVWHQGSRYTWEEATGGGDPILLGFIYNWSRDNQNWGPGLTSILSPGYGYWMYAYKECELWAQNISVFIRGDNITDLKEEWNAFGSPDSNSYYKNDLRVFYDGTIYTWSEATSGGNPIIVGFIYNWSRNDQNYGFTDYLYPGYSYWLYAYYNCSLLFPSTYLSIDGNQDSFELNSKVLKKRDIVIEDDRDINWDVTIDFDEPGGKNDYVIFGEASDGSDGQDSYDIPNPPGGIPPYIDSYFTTDFTSPYDKLIQEIKKYPDTYKVWNFTAWWTGSSSTTITISWDTDEVNNSEYNSVILYDSDDNQVADMMVNSSYSKSVSPFGIISFYIECIKTENTPPEITCPGDQSVDEGSLLEFDVTATDNETIPSLSAEVLPSGAEFTDNGDGSGTFEWTPDYDQSGNYDVTFNASDGELWDTCTVDITVNHVDRAPEITCPGAQSVNENEYLEFDVTATDPDGEIPSLSAENLPSGAEFTDNGDGTGTFKWTPTYDQSGNYDVTFTASSGGLEDTCVVDITVNNVNRPPEIICPGEKQVFEDELLEFDVSATDPDGTTPSLSAEDLPSGAEFTDNGDGTGTFSWTPGHTQEGEYDVTFIASDGDLEDDCIVHIEVFDAGPVPPNAVDDYYTVDEDSEDNVLDVLENDYDLNGDDITIVDVTDPENGTIINHGDYITYRPYENYCGEDHFTYTISDGDLTDIATVYITIICINDPPETPPAPEGPSEGKAGQTYTFTAVTTDIEGDDISYLFDWGDGTTSGWTEFFPSGTEASATHSWAKGEYIIRVQAKDVYGDKSDWSDNALFTAPRSHERSLNINPLINYFREGRSIIDFIRFIFSARSWITLYLLTT